MILSGTDLIHAFRDSVFRCTRALSCPAEIFIPSDCDNTSIPTSTTITEPWRASVINVSWRAKQFTVFHHSLDAGQLWVSNNHLLAKEVFK